MTSLVGPLYVYWSSSAELKQQWLQIDFSPNNHSLLDHEIQLISAGPKYTLLSLEPDTVCYVLDIQKKSAYAIIFNATYSDKIVSKPLRVIFSTTSTLINPRPYCEYWSVSSGQWLTSQQHRITDLQKLYAQEYRSYSSFDEIPSPPKETQSIPSPQPCALALSDVLESITIKNFCYAQSLPDILEDKCLYVIQRHECFEFSLQLHPLLVITQRVSRDRLSQDQHIFLQEKAVAEQVPNDFSDLGLLYQQLSDSLEECPLSSTLSSSNAAAQSESQHQLIPSKHRSYEQKMRLQALDKVFWGLTPSDKHTIVAVLSPDWILEDAAFFGLNRQEQHVVLAYLLYAVKPDQQLRVVFKEDEQALLRSNHLKYVDYLVYDRNDPANIKYIDILGRDNTLAIHHPIQFSQYIQQQDFSQGYCCITPEHQILYIEQSPDLRIFPREFHSDITNMLYQFMMPAGLAALFRREWSHPNETAPNIGSIYSYYQNIFMISLRLLGYTGPITPALLPSHLCSQKIADIQSHYATERLIFSGLSQRGLLIYQKIMSALYNPASLSSQSLEDLKELIYYSQLILNRDSSDLEFFEASHDILAAFTAITEIDASDADPAQQNPRVLLEEQLHKIISEAQQYEFKYLLKEHLSSKYSPQDYETFAAPILAIFLNKIEDTTTQDKIEPNNTNYSILLNIVECCDFLFEKRSPHADYIYQHALLLACHQFTDLYKRYYPQYFFETLIAEKELEVHSLFKTITFVNSIIQKVQEDPQHRIDRMPKESKHRTILHFFSQYAISYLQKNPSRFSAALASLEIRSSDRVIAEAQDLHCYISILKSFSLADQLYTKLSSALLDHQAIKRAITQYFLDVQRYLPDLNYAGLLQSASLFFSYQPGKAYDIPLSTLRFVLHNKKNVQAASQPHSLDLFQLAFYKDLESHLDHKIKKIKEDFRNQLSEKSNNLTAVEIRHYCHDIQSIDTTYLRNILLESSDDQACALIGSFFDIYKSHHHDETKAILEYYNNLSKINQILCSPTCLERSQESVATLIRTLLKENARLLQETPSPIPVEMLSPDILAKIYPSNLTLVRFYQIIQQLSGPLKQGQDSYVSTLRLIFSMISSKSRVLASCFKNNGNFLESRPLIRQIIDFDHITLLEIFFETASSDWPESLAILESNYHFFKELTEELDLRLSLCIKRKRQCEYKDDAAIELVFKYLRLFIESGPQSFSLMSLKLNDEIKRLSLIKADTSYNWLQNLLGLMASSISEQFICQQILLDFKKQGINTDDILIHEDSTSQGFPKTIYLDSGHEQQESAVDFLNRVGIEHIKKRQRSISEEICQKIQHIFLKKARSDFTHSLDHAWLQVIDLSYNFLKKWLSSFLQAPDVLEQLLPHVLTLTSVKESRINMLVLSEELSWHQNKIHHLLWKNGWHENAPLRYLNHCSQRYFVENDLQKLLSQTSEMGFYSFVTYLRQQHILMLYEWSPLLLENIQRHPERWYKSPNDLEAMIHFFGLKLLLKQGVVTSDALTDLPINALNNMTLSDQHKFKKILTEQALEPDSDRDEKKFTLIKREAWLLIYLNILREEMLSETSISVDEFFDRIQLVNQKELLVLESDIIKFLTDTHPRDIQGYFKKFFQSKSLMQDFLATLQRLSPQSQLIFLQTCLTISLRHESMISLGDMLQLKNYLFNLAPQIKNQAEQKETHSHILQQLFRLIYSRQQLADFSTIFDNSIDFYYEKILIPLLYASKINGKLDFSEEHSYELSLIFHSINHDPRRIVCIPALKDFINDVFKLAPAFNMHLLAPGSYLLIDSAEIFSIVYHKSSAKQKKNLWAYAEQQCEHWVLCFNDLLALMRCVTDINQYEVLSKKIPYYLNFIRSSADFADIITILAPVVQGTIIKHKMPSYAHLLSRRCMHNIYDYFEVLQVCRLHNQGYDFMRQYQKELLACRPNEKIDPIQLTRLKEDTLDLIKFIQEFPISFIGIELCLALLFIEQEDQSQRKDYPDLQDIFEILDQIYPVLWKKVIQESCSEHWSEILDTQHQRYELMKKNKTPIILTKKAQAYQEERRMSPQR